MPVLPVNMQETGRAQRIIERVLRCGMTQEMIQSTAFIVH